ncbi:MAG: ATPase [Verrucomicrobiaceae bacterium]|nr:ATPase [Verrucomicrobiaceae bacterium]
MTPLERYQADLLKPGFARDAAQQMAVEHLQRLYDALIAAEREAQHKTALSNFLEKIKRPKTIEPVRGLYFWGGVGRGKTYLMDTFYESLPFSRKLRAHFHRFMQRVHRDLKTLAGEKNPLLLIADQLALEARVICFDEFFVSDIADAMILGGLFEALCHRGVSFVATSNIEPDGLYRDGLQRSRFLPAIALLKKHTIVLNVDGGTDYRLRALEKAELYHFPLGVEADELLLHNFQVLVPETTARKDELLDIEGRTICARFVADDVAWFDFAELCDGPRSQNDYIELAREYHAVLIGDVPQLTAQKEDQARRFINLVDEFYDRNVKLVLTAAVSLADIYTGVRLQFEFERTKSRLLEMQSHEYLAREHRP